MISGLFGGTFDPIHYGHLITVEWVRSELALDRIILVPAGLPPHKDSTDISGAAHRLSMTRAAISSYVRYHCSDIEIRAEAVSYTELMVRHFLTQTDGTHSFRLIIGADSLREMHTWRNPGRILEAIQVIVMRRPGYPLDGVDPELLRRVSVVETPLISLSSSLIRSRVKAGKSITYMVPPAVEAYIEAAGLYR
ncbi:nicotinate (nicotinamide) nucleotide adenylyltransferase [bacterium]|nr:nicotinate (nicotinamide) nucleotide adenylyltransferase [bacterium]